MTSARNLAELHALPPTAVLTPDEAASFTRVPRATLANKRCYRTGPAFIRHGRRVLYVKSDLDAYLAAGRVETAGAGKAA